MRAVLVAVGVSIAGCGESYECQPLCRTPAEELVFGKTFTVRAGSFDDAVATCMHEASQAASCKFGATVESCSCSSPGTAARVRSEVGDSAP